MKLIVLGCGTSTGVPRIGNRWGACDPADPRNRRTRSSIIVEEDGFRILVDTGPDLRNQLLASEIASVDAVVWTHDHADHCHGIDDLRQIYFANREPLAGYASSSTLDALKQRFGYVFDGNAGYPSTARPILLQSGASIGPFTVTCTEQPHGPVSSTGLRFNAGGKSVCYAIDYHEITEDMLALYRGTDLLVTDCLRYDPHPTHAHYDLAMELISRSSAKSALLSHMDNSMDYRALSAKLPDGVAPAFDGLERIV